MDGCTRTRECLKQALKVGQLEAGQDEGSIMACVVNAFNGNEHCGCGLFAHNGNQSGSFYLQDQIVELADLKEMCS